VQKPYNVIYWYCLVMQIAYMCSYCASMLAFVRSKNHADANIFVMFHGGGHGSVVQIPYSCSQRDSR